MTEQRDLDRAMTLAEMAPSRSVRFEVLAGREEAYPRGRLHRPPVAHLEDTEAPAYVLTNAKRGIGIGTKRNTTEPSDDRGSVVLVTGRRTLCLVGQERSDEVIEIPHGEVADVSYHTGFLGHRLAVKTPRKQYHCWVGRKTDESILGRATEYVRERMPEAPYDEEPESEGEATFSYRGRPVSRENHPGIPDEPPAEPSNGENDEESGATEQNRPSAESDLKATDSDEEPQFTYRGQAVSRENHPGLPDEAPTASGNERESGELDRERDAADPEGEPTTERSRTEDGDRDGLHRGTHG